MKYRIEKGSVQETLLMPLWGRKIAAQVYPMSLLQVSDRDRLP